MELHQPAPDFELPDLEGKIHRSCDYHGKILVINFWSAECPHSARADGLILHLLKEWRGEVELLSIAANRNESARLMVKVAKARGIPIVLVDAQDVVADRYEAMTTPHVFILDRQGILRYRGAVDNVTFRRREASQFYLRDAVEALLKGEVAEPSETPPYGCTIVREI